MAKALKRGTGKQRMAANIAVTLWGLTGSLSVGPRLREKNDNSTVLLRYSRLKAALPG